MDKRSNITKMGEIRGVLAYLVDSEMVKVATQEDFDSLVEQVTNSLEDENYDLNTVMDKTAELLAEDNTDHEKTAAEAREFVEKEVGKLTLEKTAGNISDEKYELICSGLVKLSSRPAVAGLAPAISAATGASKASDLSDEEKKALKDHYNLDDESNLGLRNAGRGVAGGVGGGLGGLLLGSAAGTALAGKGHPMAGLAAGTGSALGGYILGTDKATDKYSKGNEALQNNKQNSQEK